MFARVAADAASRLTSGSRSISTGQTEGRSEYGRLFETALLRRERRADSVAFWLRADPGICEALEELARREAACCPFLDDRVETGGDVLIGTTTNTVTGDERAAPRSTSSLTRCTRCPDHPGSDVASLYSRLAERDVHVVGNDERFGLRR